MTAPERRGRWLVHLALLALAVLFLFPFFWMILTSWKTDEELAAGKWLPALPTFQSEPKHPLELFEVQIRELDASIHRVISGGEIASKWTVESGEAALVPGELSTRVKYRFDSPDAPSIVLRYDFEFPCDPSELHKLIVAVKSDDSWHRIDATLQVGGILWQSSRPTYLGQSRAMSILFQPPTFEDSTLQPKLWTPLISPAPSSILDPLSSRGSTLRLIITPSSTARAAWAKFTRNYFRVFNSIPFWKYVTNSVILVVLTTAGAVFSSAFVAYAFARLKWPGRSIAFVILLSTMMLPAQVTMVPTFLIWRQLGWYNTLNPLWVPAFFGIAFFIFMMTQHMKTIPRELEEAARIDGLNALQTWYYIILPQVKPAAAAIAIMAFMGAWNDFLGPLVYLRDQSRFPLSLGLFASQLENFGDWTLIMAGNVLMTLPVLVIFFVFQRYFVQGMTMSGMK